MTTLLELKNVVKRVDNGSNEKKILLDHLNLIVNQGDFITVLGGNGAGKSTLFNTISGAIPITSGAIFFKNNTITSDSEEKRAQFIARVFQDPKMGTAPRMTVAENLLLALNRGKRRSLHLRKLKKERDSFYALCQKIGNGLEEQLNTPTGQLSGGQRQALSLLMATLTKPDLLLLDEHTAALDPKTSKRLMATTYQEIHEKKLTCLMITHRMEDALKYGNRLIVLSKGKIIKDLNKAEKEQLTLQELFLFFEEE